MSFLDRTFARMGYTKNVAQPMSVGEAFARAQSNADQPKISTEAQTNLVANSSWVFSAVSLASQFCAKTDVDVYLAGRAVEDHPFKQLYFVKPNPYQGGFQFRPDVFAWWFLRRKVVVYLNRQGPDDPIDEMFCLNPNEVEPSWNDDRTRLLGYVYKPGGGLPIPLEPWQTMYITGWSPRGLFTELSPTEPLFWAVTADAAEVRWSANFYSRDNAKPEGALAFRDHIGDEAWENLKKEARKNWGGTNRSGPMFLRGVGESVNWISMGLSQKDTEALETRRFAKEEIYNAIAPGLLSMLSDSATRANSDAGRATFVDMTADPALTLVDECLTRDVLPAYGEGLTARHENISVTDQVVEDMEIKTAETVMTIDEIRRVYYNEKPIGDERGALLPAQIQAYPPVSGAPVQPAPANMGQQAEQMTSQMAKRLEDLGKWQRKVEKAIKRGEPADVKFESDYIGAHEYETIKSALSECLTLDGVSAVFADKAG